MVNTQYRYRFSCLALIVFLLSSLLPNVSASAQEALPAPTAASSDASVTKSVYGYSNLATGKVPAISLISKDAARTATETALLPRLTDGIEGTGDWQAEGTKYANFFRNTGRELVLSLDQISTITELSVKVIKDNASGIYLPNFLHFSLSNDGGTTWGYVGSVYAKDAVALDAKQFLYRLRGLNFQANKVKITFEVDVFIFADELKVLGTSGIVDNAAAPPAGDIHIFKEYNAYPAAGSAQAGGVKHDYLVFGGYSDNGKKYNVRNVEELLPAVAYLDTSGIVRDWMYDSFTFLPYSTASSGRFLISSSAIKGPEQAANMGDWEEFMNVLFRPNTQLDALNQAVGRAKEKLGDPSYKAKVKISIPKAHVVQNYFGVIGGTMLNFNASEVGDDAALHNRLKATKWYIDQILQKWTEAKYGNLELSGFYWYDEAQHNYDSHYEDNFVRQTTAYIHQIGKLVYWIPFYQANGYYRWKELGFDYAIMQPNYAFQAVPVTRLADAARQSKQFGVGVELEVHWNVFTDENMRKKFYAYLDEGAADKSGYMTDAVSAWYWNTDTLPLAAYSTVAKDRAVYDSTYAFIKKTYPALPQLQPLSPFDVQVSMSDTSGNALSELPKSGYVQISATIKNKADLKHKAALLVTLKRKNSEDAEAMIALEKEFPAEGTDVVLTGLTVPTNGKHDTVEVVLVDSLSNRQPLSDAVVFGREK